MKIRTKKIVNTGRSRLACSIAFLFLAAVTSYGSTYVVNSLADPGDGVCDATECALREAISEANGNAGPDTIDFSVSGTISLASSLPAITDDLEINGPGADQLTVHGGGFSFRIFEVTAVGTVGFSGITITGGSAADPVFNRDGGGIKNSGGGHVNVTASIVTGNFAYEYGGGIFNNGTLVITDSTVSNNAGSSAARGGGIANSGTLQILNSTVSGNDAGFGSSDFGGSCGGIQNSGEAEIINSTISGNLAGSVGGGICNDLSVFGASQLTIVNSTITGNVATDGGGINNTGTANLKSSIVALNAVSNIGYNLRGVFNSQGNNVFGTIDNAFIIPGTDDQFNAGLLELKLSALQDNGGPILTHSLGCGSVAIDKGVSSAGLTTDQRGTGFQRTFDDPFVDNASSGDGTDVGAFELQTGCTATADLLVSLGADKTGVRQGDLLTYTITVQSFGPDAAVNAVVNNVLSSGTSFVSARANRGNFTAPPSGQTGTVTWYLGDLSSGDQESAQIEVTVIVRGRTTITNAVEVDSGTLDPNMANNSASITTSVASGSGKKK
jgi:uncharacterized repeat protein (TIGR01451 family)/CSLREA domain-containing protein